MNIRKKIIFLLMVMSFTAAFAQRTTDEITVSSSPQGAVVEMGRREYRTPFQIALRPNMEYEFVFSMPGYKTETVKHAGGRGNLHVNLEPVNFINLVVPAGAKVFVNNVMENYTVSDSQRGGRSRNVTIQIFAPQGQRGANIRVEYYDLKVERFINFNRQSVNVGLSISN